MGGYIKFMGAIVLTMLFAIGIFSYAVNFGNDNNVAISVSDDIKINSSLNDMSDTVQTFRREQNSSLTALYESTISGGDETTITGGQFKGGIAGAVSQVKSIISLVYNKIFGGEQGNLGFGIVLTTLIAFIGFLVLMYLWQTWAGRNP